MGNILETTILSDKLQVEVFPTTDPNDSFRLTYPFKCLQFPIRLVFAMTINKSQSQTRTICGLDLENPCFSHGQLYVECPRFGKPSHLFAYTPQGLTKTLYIQWHYVWVSGETLGPALLWRSDIVCHPSRKRLHQLFELSSARHRLAYSFMPAHPALRNQKPCKLRIVRIWTDP
ncbi:ATP-dependent DNA helicase [Trichonephila clavipes]|uniref:ATP-dependent DNA helicase n=1 Tax=Trichonephila clavipes TaxID=2585209 RepID=A0A8X6UYH8_TRICX|nr:ATP-dependent DNA helicase [Trichonephila clavipes]